VYTGTTPGGTAPWVTITITDVVANQVNVRVDHNAGSAAGQFVTNVYLNFSSSIGSIGLSGEVNGNKRNSFTRGNDAVNGAAGNVFDMAISFNSSNSNGGINRLKPAEFWSGNLTAAGLSASSFNETSNLGLLAGAHVQGIGGVNSGHVTVPEPASLTMLGIAALGFLRRRQRSK
jgi:hypothetical protein